MAVAKSQATFKRCRNNLRILRNLTADNSLQYFDTKEMHLHPKNQSVLFRKRQKMFCFNHFRVYTQCRFQDVPVGVPFSKSTVFKIYRFQNLPFSKSTVFKIYRFQNLPFSKSTVFKIYRFQNLPFSKCTVFKMYRFQNLPFSKSTVFKICWQKVCRFRMNGTPIRRFYTVLKMWWYRFENVVNAFSVLKVREKSFLWISQNDFEFPANVVDMSKGELINQRIGFSR